MESDLQSFEVLIGRLHVFLEAVARRESGLRYSHLQLEQMQAYTSLISFLQPRFPFPSLDKRAIAPELALLFASKIIEKRPSLILEAGSGISTIIAGYCLEKNGGGKIISLEHESKYALASERKIRSHGLTSFVEVIYAPLTKREQHGEVWNWYDTSFLKSIGCKAVELLFIDGPPGRLHKMARYPALPLLFEALSDSSSIVIDDANRADESEMIRCWLREFPLVLSGKLRRGKGAVVLECVAKKPIDL